MVDHFFYFKIHNKNYYKEFLIRYEKFFDKWNKQTSDPEKLEELKPHFIILLGAILIEKISCVKNFKKILKRYEEGSKKITDVERAVLKHFLDEVFLLPEVILDSVNEKNQIWEADKLGIMRSMNMQQGNPLNKRKSGSIEKYQTVARLIKIFTEFYPNINGIQKKACEIAGCSPASFSKWKNFSEENNDLYFMWQEEIRDEQIETLKVKITEYIGN